MIIPIIACFSSVLAQELFSCFFLDVLNKEYYRSIPRLYPNIMILMRLIFIKCCLLERSDVSFNRIRPSWCATSL